MVLRSWVTLTSGAGQLPLMQLWGTRKSCWRTVPSYIQRVLMRVLGREPSEEVHTSATVRNMSGLSSVIILFTRPLWHLRAFTFAWLLVYSVSSLYRAE